MAGILNLVYTVAVLLVAIAGVVAVNWMTPSVSSGRAGGEGRLSETSITIGVALFLLATGALLVTA